MSRRLTSLALCLAALPGSPALAAEFATGLAPCKNTFPAPGAETRSQIAALDLLGSVTQLGGRYGQGVLASNLATSVAINNRATPAVRARALVDAQITDSNAFTLADGLGATMAEIYRRHAPYESDDDGRTKRCGEIGPAVAAEIARANGQSGGDSNAGKLGFAGGLDGAYRPPMGGVTDVLGKAYHRPARTPGAGKYGNARPFLAAPLGATGPHIETFDGADFFGRRMSSRVVLTGATPVEAAAGLNGTDITDSPSYPSGHTTFAYTEALVLAMMVPERLQALAYRGSEYGNSRIVLGAHYPIDVIAGRTLATYDLAQDLAGRPHYAGGGASFASTLAAAAEELRDVLRRNGCPSIALCAREPIARAGNAATWVDGEPKPASPRGAYAFRLTYGLTPIGATDRPPEPVPEEAGLLLQSRFPYLTPTQRREVLRTTEGPSGYFLDASPLDGAPLAAVARGPGAQAGVYSRLDLFAAAGGFASLAEQVVVDQDPDAIADPNLKAFDDLAHFDTWSNDIGGPGGLTKRGRGTLRLTGRNTFTGPAIVENGSLEIVGSLSADTRIQAGGSLAGPGTVGNVEVATGGSLTPGSVDGGGTLTVAGWLTLAKDAALLARPGSDSATPLISVEGRAILDGAKLIVSPRVALKPGTRLTVLEAKKGVSGTFADVMLDAPSLTARVSYGANGVYLTTDVANRTRPSLQRR